jgi:predicted PhzF superfamily epimerase YddE/YHI9
MTLPVTIVDAFTSTPFEGNPAAVCVVDAPRDDEWMRRVACETNLPATTFVHPTGDGFGLRWFAKAVELQLCGHGTLATSHVLWESGLAKPDEPLRFHTNDGALTARREGRWIALDFPALDDRPAAPPDALLEALDVTPSYVGRGRLDYIVEIEGDRVRDLRPDFARLLNVETRGVIVTGRSPDPAFDFVSRFFSPATGLNEDFVTGSAHCCLAPFWARRLGKTSLLGCQQSARGGTVKVDVEGDRVRLAGEAVTVLHGQLLV